MTDVEASAERRTCGLEDRALHSQLGLLHSKTFSSLGGDRYPADHF
ncbi:hypothetical protein CVCC1112_4504 [Paenarthrobacter nicotinovorans]|nr:hypothetical protein CVCC1112_4504 [Paenarthrobacter nicotinovorans]